jgi:hypothetical protein
MIKFDAVAYHAGLPNHHTGAAPNASDFTSTQNTSTGNVGTMPGPSTSSVNDFGGNANTYRSG